jgi:hypothetical protein
MTNYPMLHFLMRFGNVLAAGLAAFIVACGIYLAVGSGDVLWTLGAVVIAAVGYALFASYVELIRLITDMLLPKP